MFQRDNSGEHYKIKVLEVLFQLKNMERQFIPPCVLTAWIWRGIYWRKVDAIIFVIGWIVQGNLKPA